MLILNSANLRFIRKSENSDAAKLSFIELAVAPTDWFLDKKFKLPKNLDEYEEKRQRQWEKKMTIEKNK